MRIYIYIHTCINIYRYTCIFKCRFSTYQKGCLSPQATIYPRRLWLAKPPPSWMLGALEPWVFPWGKFAKHCRMVPPVISWFINYSDKRVGNSSASTINMVPVLAVTIVMFVGFKAH